jgi:hypothetical protein
MPMMQNPNGTVTRLPYPGEPGYQGGATPPASGAPSSTDPDHHEAQAPKRRTRQKVAS